MLSMILCECSLTYVKSLLWVKSRPGQSTCPLYPHADICSAQVPVRFGPTADIKHAAAQPGRSMTVTEPFRDRTGVQALAKNACFGLGRTPGPRKRNPRLTSPATGDWSDIRRTSTPRGVSVALKPRTLLVCPRPRARPQGEEVRARQKRERHQALNKIS